MVRFSYGLARVGGNLALVLIALLTVAAAAAEQARVEALRWHYRLLIDAHLIWGLEDE